MRQTNQRNAIARRPGFTLVEMLVVVAIIAILIGLGTAAIMRTRIVQENNNTITLVTKVDQAFQKQWLRVVDTAKTEAIDQTSLNLAGAGTPVYDARRARVIHIKLVLMREFPVSFKEIQNPVLTGGANPAYQLAIAKAQAGRTPAEESSACLYLALKQGRRGGDSDPDTFLSAQEVTDPIGDGIKEIVDAWKSTNPPYRPQPLIFSRFPLFAPSLTAGTPPSGLAGVVPASGDPVDPENLLTNANWINTCGAAFQQVVGYAPTPTPLNMAPAIYSVGYGQGFAPIYNFQVSKR